MGSKNIVTLTFLRIFFLLLPVTVFSAWALTSARDVLEAHGVHVPRLLYTSIAIVVLYIPAWLTVDPFVKEMRKRKRQAQQSVSHD